MGLKPDKHWKVLSLFDGIGGARVALERLGAKIDYYVASEINKPSISVVKEHFPDTIHIGDVNNGISFNIDYDLIIFGSPCTDLSIAKKNRQSLQGRNSQLFYKAANLIKVYKPKYFLMENVASMSEASKDEISTVLGVRPQQINSRWFTGQNRERLYWFNWIQTNPLPSKPVWFRDKLLQHKTVFYNLNKELSISRKGREYMLRRTKDGRDHYDFGHHSDTDKPFSSCIVSNFKKGVPYNVLIDQRNHQMGPWIRKFHPIECERLQGFDDDYTKILPWTHRFECLGNAFTVDVIEYLLKPII